MSSKYVRIKAFLENGTLYLKAGRAVHSRTVFISSHMVCSVGSVRRLLKEQVREMAPMAAASRPYRYGSTYRVGTYFLDNKYYSTPENCLIFWWFTACPKKYIKDRRMTDRVFIRIQCNFPCLAGYAYPISLKSND